MSAHGVAMDSLLIRNRHTRAVPFQTGPLACAGSIDPPLATRIVHQNLQYDISPCIKIDDQLNVYNIFSNIM